MSRKSEYVGGPQSFSGWLSGRSKGMSDTPMIDRVLKDGSIAERNIRYTVALQRIFKLGGPGAAIAYEALNPLERHPVTGKGLSSTPSGGVES